MGDMHIINQPAMKALARADPDDNLHIVDLPYRFSSWAMDQPDNVALWVDDGGRLQAWAVMQTPFWTIDYVFHPTSGSNLHKKILAWANQRARQILDTPFGHPSWYVNVFATQAERIHELEELGFASQADVGEDSWSEVLLRRSSRLKIEDYPIPAGFEIRPLAGEDEIDANIQLQRAVFGTENMTESWRRRIIQRPEYRPELDLVAVAPDGRLAAFCIGWFDPRDSKGAIGQIEPIGVHEDFRQLGLSRAILFKCLLRLQQFGVDWVYVQTDTFREAAMQLYQSVGFRAYKDVLVFRKDYGGSTAGRDNG